MGFILLLYYLSNDTKIIIIGLKLTKDLWLVINFKVMEDKPHMTDEGSALTIFIGRNILDQVRVGCVAPSTLHATGLRVVPNHTWLMLGLILTVPHFVF